MRIWLSSPISISDSLKKDVCISLLHFNNSIDSFSTDGISAYNYFCNGNSIGYWTQKHNYEHYNLLEADVVVFFLDSWSNSLPKGCLREYQDAVRLGKKIYLAYKPNGRSYRLYDCCLVTKNGDFVLTGNAYTSKMIVNSEIVSDADSTCMLQTVTETTIKTGTASNGYIGNAKHVPVSYENPPENSRLLLLLRK